MEATYTWTPAFVSALQEVQFEELPQRIADAERAIFTRFADSEILDPRERMKISDAQNALSGLTNSINRGQRQRIQWAARQNLGN